MQPLTNSVSNLQQHSHFERRVETTGPDGKTHVYIESSDGPPKQFTTTTPPGSSPNMMPSLSPPPIPVGFPPTQLGQNFPQNFPQHFPQNMASQLLHNTINTANTLASQAQAKAGFGTATFPTPLATMQPPPQQGGPNTGGNETHTYERRVEVTGPDGKTHVRTERHMGDGPVPTLGPVESEMVKFGQQPNMNTGHPQSAMSSSPQPPTGPEGVAGRWSTSTTPPVGSYSPMQQHSPPHHYSPQAQAGGGSPSSSHIMPHVLGQQALRRHNELREHHGAAPLSWDPQLADSAQQWAEQCVQENFLRHTPIKRDPRIGEFGECVYSSGATTPTGSEVTDSWFEERVQYIPGVGNHFSQVLWKSTRAFGVGVAVNKRGQYYVVARYYPAGNLGDPAFYMENVPSTAVIPQPVFMGSSPNSSVQSQNYTTSVQDIPLPPHYGSVSSDGSQQQHHQSSVESQSSPQPPPPITATLDASVLNWSIDQVVAWLGGLQLGEYAGGFIQNEVDGNTLSTLTKDDLRVELDIKRLSDRKFLWSELNRLFGRADTE